MDEMAPRYKDLELGLENGVSVSEEEEEEEEEYSRISISGVKKKVESLIAKVKGGFGEGSDDRVSLFSDTTSNSGNGFFVENLQGVMKSMNVKGQESKNVEENKLGKEKRKSLGHKKPPRPPRPPRAPSLDAADQKLIREIAELARLKRAKIEQMKALKKMKAAKATSSNSSSMFAMVFTIIFCLVIMFQGMSSGSTSASYQGSPVPERSVEWGLISVQFSGNPYASFPNGPDSGSPFLVEQVAGLDT